MPFVWIGVCQMVCAGVLLIVINSVFAESLAQPEPCGIPIVWWNYMFWSLICYCMFHWIITIPVGLLAGKSEVMGAMLLSMIAITFYTMAGWTIYGYQLYNSLDNDCSLSRESSGWNTTMVVLLVIGTIFILYSVCMTCILPIAIYQMVK